MKPITAIAMSGGIDSLTAASILKDHGHDVVGLHFVTGYESGGHSDGHPVSPSTRDRIESARSKIEPLTERLGIPLHIIDVSEPFQNHVISYFTRTYQEGRTPNPCLVCNPFIKFDVVWEHARALGATQLATGHYARVTEGNDGVRHLRKGCDPQKDQSYFLAFLSTAQLNRACFPLGEMTKADVRSLAESRKLRPVTQSESQDICFIREGNYAEFLAAQEGIVAKGGPIEDVHGRTVGSHEGLHRFTVGQRRGINCPAPTPYYVVRIDWEKNRLVVGSKTDLLDHQCQVGNINWIQPPPDSAIRVKTRVRYRHRAALSRVETIESGTAMVLFDEPQSAIAPGQGAVFYRDDEVLGGGFIE